LKRVLTEIISNMAKKCTFKRLLISGYTNRYRDDDDDNDDDTTTTTANTTTTNNNKFKYMCMFIFIIIYRV
jgi:hypothetical protein